MPTHLELAATQRPTAWRLVAALVLLVLEVALALHAIDFDWLKGHDVWWAEPMRQLSHNAPWGACVLAVVALLGVGRWRRAFLQLADGVPSPRSISTALAVHTLAAFLFAALSALILAGGSTVAVVQSLLPFAWLACGALLVGSIGLAAAPIESWRSALAPLWRSIALGVCVGSALFWLAWFVDGNYFLWGPFADVTLRTSAALLGLLTSDVYLEPDTRILGVGAFRVIVSKYCSGLEGLALFGIFFASFMVLARERLRLARAAWLLPIGLVCVWLLNAVRIAALVALGAFYDPELAVEAFHTHAGWPPLVAVALLCVAIATRVPAFARAAPGSANAARSASSELRTSDGTANYLLPLLAVVATGLVAGAFLNEGASSAPLRVLVGFIVLWRARRGLPGTGNIAAIALNVRHALMAWHVWLLTLAALAVWLWFDETHGVGVVPPGWLADAPVLLAAGFWVAAALSYAVVTPLVEELAFRGYVQRRLVATDFESVRYRRLAPHALLGSALVFGALHSNWIGGVLVGLLCSLAAARRERLTDAVVVHALVNGALAALAVATGRFGLWF